MDKAFINYLDKTTVDVIWDKFLSNPELTSKLLEQLNAEARWAKETGKVTNDTKTPDFDEYIYRDGLKKVKAENVKI